MSKLKFSPNKTKEDIKDFWTILIADDEGTVHLVTEMVLKDFRFDNKSIKLISAYSGLQTIEKIKEEDNIAVILLDVVMETINAGLDVVTVIRNELQNHEVRLVLRTGQSGTAKISEIIKQYDINDYKNKERLTTDELKNTVLFALRAYKDIQSAKNK